MTYERDPRGPRPVLQKRRRGALAPTLIALGVLIVLGLIASKLWTEVLWYQQVGYLKVYRTELITKVVMFLVGGLLMGAAVAASLLIGYRSRPIYAPVSAEQAGLDRYRESIEPLRRLVSIAVPLILALFAGSAASQEWQVVQLWMHRVPFGQRDQQFHMDIGFFVFTLPWLQFIIGFLTAVVLLSAITGLVTHYLYGGLRLQGAGRRLTSAARIHLSVLAALFLLLRGIDYWLGRFALTTKDSKSITGLTYTDANAVLTARGVLAGIALVVAVLFVIAAVVDRWRLIPLYGVALLVVSAIVIGGIYPAAVQRFKVTPSARQYESEYIKKNIDATRDAYGLAKIQATNFPARTDANAAALRDSAESIPGIRLLDPSLIGPTFGQLQQIKQYYAFPDSLDVDRYKIDGQNRDTVIATRELNIAGTGQRSWVNDHINYTHGFGVVAAYGNQRTTDGKPVFFQQGIPSIGALGTYEPRIYFGERSPDYSIVGAPKNGAPQELDFPDDKSASGQQNTTYHGSGGVAIGSTFRKFLYALKFQDQNILLSKQVNSDSRILYDRTPRQRVEKVAPFLTLDGDPYPAVIDGRVKWIVDGYTTTSHYPYSKTQSLHDATSDSITEQTSAVAPLDDKKINYIRNSVKATVDAYDGTVTLYTWDAQDPVLKAWTKVFPNIVKPLSQIDSQLMSHVRYPEDLFKVQRELLQNYHVTDPGAFYGGQDFWSVPDDPTRGNNSQLQPPYYLTLQMPDQKATTFSLTSTFVPTGRTRGVLTGFLAVDSDAGDIAGAPRAGYGQLRLLQLPRDTVISGPGLVQSAFNSDPAVSQVLNLLQQSSTTVERGNLLTLPLAGGLLYVQPVYVRSAGTNSYPLLQKVLVAFGDKIGFEDTLDGALDKVFGTTNGTSAGTTAPGTGTPTTPGTGTQSAAQIRLQTALQAAVAAVKESDAALKAGDLAAYAVAQKKLTKAVQDASDAEQAVAGESSTKSTPTPSGSVVPSASATPVVTVSPTPTTPKK